MSTRLPALAAPALTGVRSARALDVVLSLVVLLVVLVIGHGAGAS